MFLGNNQCVWTTDDVHDHAVKEFLEKTLPEWTNTCEKYLQALGNIGHFIGNMVNTFPIPAA